MEARRRGGNNVAFQVGNKELKRWRREGVGLAFWCSMTQLRGAKAAASEQLGSVGDGERLGRQVRRTSLELKLDRSAALLSLSILWGKIFNTYQARRSNPILIQGNLQMNR
jgi:hypothetical protein